MSHALFSLSLARRPVATSLAAILLGFAVFALPAQAQLKDPRPTDRYVAMAVAGELQRGHLTKHPLDAEMSKRCLTTFLKTLDPMKVYFLQSDVDTFNKAQDEKDIAQQIKRGDISLAYTIFRTFLARVDDNMKLIDDLLAKEPDFTIDEEMQTDPKEIVYVKDASEMQDRWRKRLKYDLLVQKLDKVADKEAHDKLTRRYHSFEKRMHQIDGDELLEMYLTALTTGFDPHTTYMSPSSVENFDIMMRLKLDGIGASLQFDDGVTKVSKLIPGGAAEKDGRLKPEDRLIAVAQDEAGDFVDTMDMSLNDVVKLVRGKAGTVVRLKVLPVGQTVPKVYDITRASIELKDSEARGEVIEDGKKANGSPYKVGVIDLPSFYMDMAAAHDGRADFKSTTRDVKKLLADFRSKNVDAVILDLRRNGGGSLQEAISLTGLFIDQGPMVLVKDSDGRVQHFDDPERGMAWEGPLVVLTSKFSASASEILAGAIQDYHRGLIVGDEATHGKGTVQSLLDVGQQLFSANPPKLGSIKITMQQFYRPSGVSTQNRGVVADVALPSLTSHLDVGEKDLDYALKFDQVAGSPFAVTSMVSPAMVTELKNQSIERTDKSEDFKKLAATIERYEAQKKRKMVSLNETKFMEERTKNNSAKEEEKELKELDDPNRPVVKRDYYFNEALAVTLDYVRLVVPKLAAR